jgi:hypothetical protein
MHTHAVSRLSRRLRALFIVAGYTEDRAIGTCCSRGLSQEEGVVPSLEGVELMAVLLGDAKRLAAHAVPSGCPAALPAGVPTSGAKPACDGDATCTPSEMRPWSMHDHKHVIFMLHKPPAIREGASADELHAKTTLPLVDSPHPSKI